MPRHANRKSAARAVQKILDVPFTAGNRFADQAELKLTPSEPHSTYVAAVSAALEEMGLPTQSKLTGRVNEVPVGFLKLERTPLTLLNGVWYLGLQWTMHEGVGWLLHASLPLSDSFGRWSVGGADIVPDPGCLAEEVRDLFAERRLRFTAAAQPRTQTLEEAQRALSVFAASSASTERQGA
ncbi:hypothetical protein AB0O50_33145 [Streptomyces cyaneofuscatus]|uniref:hypothetical protein n=1 Tax=Streptomyces cyaneofuscatus TaxID=66883 RepID=UPI00343B6864